MTKISRIFCSKKEMLPHLFFWLCKKRSFKPTRSAWVLCLFEFFSSERWLFCCQQNKGFCVNFNHTNKKRDALHLSFSFMRETGLEPVWCGTTRPSNVRGCQFRHSRVFCFALSSNICYYTQKIWFVNTFFKKSLIFFDIFFRALYSFCLWYQ